MSEFTKRYAIFAVGLAGLSSAAMAQDAAQPADGQLPEVEVIQQKAPPAKKKAAPMAKKAAPPAAVPAPMPPPQDVFEEAPALANSPYGSPASGGAQARAEQSAQTPVNPTQLIPETLDGFSAAGTNLTSNVLQERQPRNINEALTRVPGVIVINDDANAHHGGIAVRGSPARRSRKMLVMEDGHAVNLALWLDPSVHYWAPSDRVESIEVIRGTVVTHGPNNNFGVINARNLSPFGPNETVISSAIGFTKSRGGSFTPLAIDDDDVKKKVLPSRGEETRIFRRAGTFIRAKASTTSASSRRIRVPTFKAPGTLSAYASTTSTARSAGRAAARIWSSRRFMRGSVTITTSRISSGIMRSRTRMRMMPRRSPSVLPSNNSSNWAIARRALRLLRVSIRIRARSGAVRSCTTPISTRTPRSPRVSTAGSIAVTATS